MIHNEMLPTQNSFTTVYKTTTKKPESDLVISFKRCTFKEEIPSFYSGEKN